MQIECKPGVLWLTSDATDKIAPAYVKASALVQQAVENATNPRFGRYADLTAVSDACKAALREQGITYMHVPMPASRDGHMALSVILIHSSGQYIGGQIEMPLPKSDPQGYGSALTYARRYSLASICGVLIADDDGNAASSDGGDDLAPGRDNFRGQKSGAGGSDL
jgi:hypothetical protein